MSQVIETPGLSKEDADATAENLAIDDIPVDIIPQDDGTFTVRATYPDGAVIPQAAQAAAPPTPQNNPLPAAPPREAPSGGSPQTISSKGAKLIQHFESCMKVVSGGFQAYLDPVQVLTIGWGHTNDNGRQFDASSVWTQAECDAEFLNDMRIFENAVHRLVTVPLNQNEFDALVSFTFNVGAGNLKSSTLLKKLNDGDFAGAAQEFARWNKAGGVVLAGLTKRRTAEALLFQGLPDGITE